MKLFPISSDVIFPLISYSVEVLDNTEEDEVIFKLALPAIFSFWANTGKYYVEKSTYLHIVDNAIALSLNNAKHYLLLIFQGYK